ncbi:MAG TPA: hypothetical protein PKN17_00995, partial [Bacillota bacterium]|nr:hypothetical protein [Bacillota bacterium]
AGMYLNLSNSLIILSTGKTTEWRYSYGTQKLYTVSKVSYAPQYITRSGSSVAFTTNLAETWLYEALPNGSGGYTLRRLESTMQNAGRDVVIVMYSGSQYYAVTRSGTSNIVATQINLNGTNVNANMIWKYDGSRFYYESAGVTRYLRMGSSTLTTSTDAEYFETRYTTTSFTTTTTSGQATYFGIFRVDMSSELDDVTDISTMLTGRAMLTPTISLLESSRCVLVAEVDYDGDDNIDKYYSLGMVNSSISQAIDITYQLKTALATGSTITLFDSCVWEQRGSGSVLIFDNCGFEDKYYLTGSLGNRDSMEPVVIHIPGETEPDNISDFNWRTYNFGDGSYLFGYTEESGDEDRVYYLYFDTVSLTFRLTSSLTKAKLGGGVVQIYQLGTKTVEQPNYTTIIIVTDDDTIVSYPLNLVESKTDLKKYQVIDEDGDGQPKVEGEYLIVSRSGASFYALTLDDFGGLAYIDVSPYFCGNYSRDNLGRPCLAINQRYIWQQTEDVYTYMPTRLIFRNATSTPEKPLILAGSAVFDYDFENHRLFYTSDGTMRYLNFTVAGGFEFSSEQAGEEIYLYSLGELGIDTGDGGTLNYTYYSIPLSTSLDSGVTFGNFEFIKKKIPELTHYGVGTSGMIEKSVGWKLSVNGERLTQVTSSVFFAKGYTYNPEAEKPLLDFAAEFSECSSPYAVSNGTGGEAHAGTIDYYAPAGMASFVIAEASSSKPVFVNVIVSTEFDQIRLNPEFLRYLALWRVADINIQNGTAKTLKTYEGEGAGVIMDYVYTFEQKLNTPDFAIPLPNRYASEASGASYARVEGEDYILSDPAYGEDYLIAHTFVITKPGIYYLGATYGSVAICYLSIDNTAEGETAGGTGYSEEFSIDFCYGSIDLGVTSEFTPATADLLLESLCYVGKEGWYHSNIYPIFTAGTAQNLTDRLDMNVVRVKNPDNTSSVNIKAYTRARIAPGVQYINDNTLAQREVRKVSFRVFCDGLAAGLYGKEATIYWTASKSETDNTFRIYSTYSIGGVINSYYLSADSSVPMLSTSGSYYWTCDEHGYLMSPDEKYLTYNQETFSLSPNPVNAVVLYKPDGGILVPVSSISHGGAYLLLVPVDGGYIMLKIAPEAE